MQFFTNIIFGKGKKGRRSFLYLLCDSLKTTYITPTVLLASAAFPRLLLSSICKPTLGVSSNLCASRNKIDWYFFLYCESEMKPPLHCICRKVKVKALWGKYKKQIYPLVKVGACNLQVWCTLQSSTFYSEYVVSLFQICLQAALLCLGGRTHASENLFSLPLGLRVWASLQVLNFSNLQCKS